MNIEFHCKDKTLALHYTNMFRDRFKALLEKCPPENLRGARLRMTDLMLAEAKKQEHWDYYLTGDGWLVPHRRVLRRNKDGSPVLLIPEIIVRFQGVAN